MNKPDFEKCTALATELLSKQNIKGRILNIRNLNYDKTIVFDSIQNYATMTHRPISDFLSPENQILNDGCIVSGSDVYVVLYNNQITNFEHLNWTLAHEVGHIYLGHTCDDEKEEIEAHFFAAQLFMPEHSLFMMTREYGPINKYDLVEIFGVSENAAEKRIKTMQRKSCVRASKMDKEIWEQQRERVNLYYQCKKNREEYRFTLDFMLYFDAQQEMLMTRELYAM